METIIGNPLEAQNIIQSGLSYLITKTLASHESERHYPCADPDKMDDKIKATGERVKTLRRLREEFENEMAKPI